MNKNKFTLLFLIITFVLFMTNIAIIIIFNSVKMEDNFYKSLNVASLSIAFLSFIASSFFSLSVYQQSKTQNKINENLPKKDDQYIINNYALFNIEQEVSIFSLNNDEKDNVINDGNYLYDSNNENITELTRFVFLPTNTINKPIYKVNVKSINFIDSKRSSIFNALTNKVIDCQYSSNILQRGYNCICIDIAENFDCIKEIMKLTNSIEIELDIISVFNVNMSTKFIVKLADEKNVENNPDKQTINDLITYNIHHSNYTIKSKKICEN